MALILLVDDDDDIAEMMLEILDILGHDARRAANAADALQLVADGLSPDLVLSDLVMPGGMSGLELLAELRTRLPGLPAVLTTGYAERSRDIAGLPVPVLVKPFRTEDLEATLDAALAGPK